MLINDSGKEKGSFRRREHLSFYTSFHMHLYVRNLLHTCSALRPWIALLCILSVFVALHCYALSIVTLHGILLHCNTQYLQMRGIVTHSPSVSLESFPPLICSP
jgi:hypothetical protein